MIRLRSRPLALAVATGALVTACGTAGPGGQQPAPPSSPAPTTPAPTPTPTSTPTVDPPPSPTPAPSSSATATAVPHPRSTTTLRFGDSGPTVLAHQQRLAELGYWLGEPDGTFGALTQQATYALQKAAGLRGDGVVGPETRRALHEGARPRAQLSGSGIEIDLERQLLLVVEDGEVAAVLNTSTGSGERYRTDTGGTARAVTPRGRFRVTRAIDGLRHSPLGVLWRPRYFNGGIAVHGAPEVPPWPASHGCVRVSYQAMDWIWRTDRMPVGSVVLVR